MSCYTPWLISGIGAPPRHAAIAAGGPAGRRAGGRPHDFEGQCLHKSGRGDVGAFSDSWHARDCACALHSRMLHSLLLQLLLL